VYKDDPGKKIVHADFKAPKKIYFEQSESKNLHKQEDNTSFLENETVRDVNIGKMEELDAIRVVNLRAGPGRNSCCYGMVQSIWNLGLERFQSSLRVSTLDAAYLNDIDRETSSETNTWDEPIDEPIDSYEKFCINLIRKFNACPPDIESQSCVKFAKKHTFPLEVAELIIDSEGHCFYRACLSETEPLDRSKLEEIMKQGNFWNEESETYDKEIKIQFGPIYIEFTGQDRIDQSNLIYWSKIILQEDKFWKITYI